MSTSLSLQSSSSCHQLDNKDYTGDDEEEMDESSTDFQYYT
jgi:hypothetical protein